MSSLNLKRKLDDVNTPHSILNCSEVLNEKLSHRPDRNQLISKGILHDSQCAPSLQNAEHALKRARLADHLNTQLLNRPGPLDLITKNILHIDTNEHPHLEQAIQDGEIPFKKTPSSTTRPLIFHEYTGPPSSCKPKITKMDSLKSSSNAHQIRLAQQQLLLELTSEKGDDDQSSQPMPKPLEQMTKIELRDLCKQYQIPSSHSNKTTLIQRIKQSQEKLYEQKSAANETFTDDLFSSLKLNEIEQIEPFSTKELDEILQSIPIDFLHEQKDEKPTDSIFDLDESHFTLDHNDQLFLQFLLDNDPTTTTSSTNTFDHLFPSDYPSYLPKITNIDEFDAFLTDFPTSSSVLSTNHIY